MPVNDHVGLATTSSDTDSAIGDTESFRHVVLSFSCSDWYGGPGFWEEKMRRYGLERPADECL